jgi:hypothetical protein
LPSLSKQRSLPLREFWNTKKDHSEIDRHLQKNEFFVSAKISQWYRFLVICIKIFKKCKYDPNFFSSQKYNMGNKIGEFNADFK